MRVAKGAAGCQQLCVCANFIRCRCRFDNSCFRPVQSHPSNHTVLFASQSEVGVKCMHQIVQQPENQIIVSAGCGYFLFLFLTSVCIPMLLFKTITAVGTRLTVYYICIIQFTGWLVPGHLQRTLTSSNNNFIIAINSQILINVERRILHIFKQWLAT